MTDDALVRRYAAQRDAEAFRALVERYADFVYATCLRVTGNPHDAEDAAQECFLALARKAASIETSPAGWLHATARNASLAIAKGAKLRTEREAAMAATNHRDDASGWKELEPHIDEALAGLSDELKTPLILHYLEGKPQFAVAEALGVDQSTVSRRLEKGVDELRKRLAKAGVTLTVAALVSALGVGAAQAAPPALGIALGKMALAGVGKTGAAATTTFLGTVAGKVALVAAAGVIAATGFVAYRAATKTEPPVPTPAPQPVVTQQPQVEKTVTKRVLPAIPRFARRIQRLDDQGRLVGLEVIHRGPELVGCLYCAFKMMGQEIAVDEISAASGEAFRFTFGENWSHDPEHITPVDALESACDVLGFEHTSLRNRDLAATLAAVEKSIDEGRPALIGVDRTWRLIVGYDREANQYYWIDGFETLQAKVGEKLSETVPEAECHRMTIPDDDWFSCVYGPDQIARNAVFLVGKRKPDAGDSVGKTLRLALDVNGPREIERQNMPMRLAARSDFMGRRPGRFFTGTSAMRRWAAEIAKLNAPSHDFGIIHANDTTLRIQAEKMQDAARYLARASDRLHGDAAAHLREAQKAFDAADKVDLNMLCVWTCDIYDGKKLQEALAVPSLVAIVDADKRNLLGDFEGRARNCPWGLSVIPDEKNFALARDAAVTNLNRIADLRDAGFAEIEKALAAANHVVIEGVPDGKFGIQWDMLVRAMQTLLTFRGEKPTYNGLIALSGDAFNLCHGSHWQGVSYLCIPTDPTANIARAYGFEYACTSDGYTGAMLQNKTRGERLALANRALDRIRAEIDAGRPALLVGGEAHCGSVTIVVGYDRLGEKLCHVGDGKPYRWTLVRGVAPGAVDETMGIMDGRLRGTIREGFAGGWQANPAYLIGEKIGAPDTRTNAVAALRRAVQLYRAPKQAIDWWGGVNYYFGREAYEQWAKDLHDLDYPADLKKELPKDAYDWYTMGNMDTQVDQVVKGRTAAAEFCETSADVLPQGKDHLLAAAKLYREEVAIAEEAFAVFRPPWNGNDAPRVAWLSDETKRESGVAAIGMMLGKERAAVAEIETALAAADENKRGNPVANVKRENGAVWIEGVKPARGGMSSVMQALATVMQAAGEDLSYDYLMGVSGHAFRIQMSAPPGWCPSSPHAFCGFNCWTTVMDALPYEMVDYPIVTGKGMKPDPALAKKALAAVVASIDKGMPVQFGSEEESVCIGYADGGATMLVMSDEEPFKPLPKLPWGIHVVGNRKTPMARAQLLKRSLELAVKMWNTPEIGDASSTPVAYVSGKHAWEVWIAGLTDDAKFERMSDEKQEDPDSFFGNALGNAWTYRSLVSARHAASGYLKSITGEFNEPAAGHLRAAADHYQQVSDTLRPGQRCAPYPWDMKTKANWTKEMREAQAKIMKEAFPLEEKAVAEIQAALNAIAKPADAK